MDTKRANKLVADISKSLHILEREISSKEQVEIDVPRGVIRSIDELLDEGNSHD